jgi:hypothetical protein
VSGAVKLSILMPVYNGVEAVWILTRIRLATWRPAARRTSKRT